MFKVWNCFLEHLQLVWCQCFQRYFVYDRSPFTNQGITGYAKFGQTIKRASVQMITLIMGFMAKAFNKYVAGKINFTYMRGTSGMQ
jgi:hypothetical protein